MTKSRRFTRVPDPVLHAEEADGTLRCRFEVEGEAQALEGDAAISLECDVLVRGTLKKNGLDQAWVLDKEPPVLLESDVFHLYSLDVIDLRDWPTAGVEGAARVYSLSGQTEVFLGGQPGDILEMDLSFVARLLDRQTDPPTLIDEQSWDVVGAASIAPSDSTAEAATDEEDTLYARVWHDSRGAPWSGILMVVRRASLDIGQSILPDSAICDLSAIGASGSRRVTRQDSTIAGSARSSTWTIMFELDGSDPPHALMGMLRNKPFILPLAPIQG